MRHPRLVIRGPCSVTRDQCPERSAPAQRGSCFPSRRGTIHRALLAIHPPTPSSAPSASRRILRDRAQQGNCSSALGGGTLVVPAKSSKRQRASAPEDTVISSPPGADSPAATPLLPQRSPRAFRDRTPVPFCPLVRGALQRVPVSQRRRRATTFPSSSPSTFDPQLSTANIFFPALKFRCNLPDTFIYLSRFSHSLKSGMKFSRISRAECLAAGEP
jgi:hypothetical protein